MSARRTEQPTVMAKLAAMSSGRDKNRTLLAVGPSLPKQPHKTNKQIDDKFACAQYKLTHLHSRTSTGNLLHVMSTSAPLKGLLSPPSNVDEPVYKYEITQTAFTKRSPLKKRASSSDKGKDGDDKWNQALHAISKGMLRTRTLMRRRWQARRWKTPLMRSQTGTVAQTTRVGRSGTRGGRLRRLSVGRQECLTQGRPRIP